MNDQEKKMRTVPGSETPKETSDHTQLFVALGAIVVLAALFAGGLWYVESRSIESVEVLESGEELTTAREGKVVPNFPDELLAEGDNTVERSYSLSYENGAKQPVVIYRSALSFSEVVMKLAEHFNAQGWQIVVDPNPGALTLTSFYAVKENSEANVTFVKKDGYVRVEIAVVNR